MKTRFKHNIQGMTGKLDGLVYYYYKKANAIYARKYTPPRRNPSAERFKLVMANLKLINPSEAYRQEFRDYLVQYNNLPANHPNQVINWTGLYLKMLYAMVKLIPYVDLATLSRAQIYDQNLPCRNLKAAIDAELLPPVKNYAQYTAMI